jgi:hypothetical protein
MFELRRETFASIPEIERERSEASLHVETYRESSHQSETDEQRDIKSPITVAQQKQLTKLGLPPTSTVNVLPKIKPASDTSISPTKATLQPGGTSKDGRDARGLPELPSPGIKEDGTKMAGAIVDVEGRLTNVTYAVSIYP